MAGKSVYIWISPVIEKDTETISVVKRAMEAYGEGASGAGWMLRDVPHRDALKILDALLTRRWEIDATKSSRGIKLAYTHLLKKLSHAVMGRGFYMWSLRPDMYNHNCRHVSGLFRRIGIPEPHVA